jgi:hypothetical protein
MELPNFAQVVTYTIDPNVQPLPATISAVRNYNQLRVTAAKKASKNIPNEVIQLLRQAHAVDIIHAVPKHAKCIITKQYINNGITLLLHPKECLLTVGSHHRETLRNLFIIFHFDDEIRKAYHDWMKRCNSSSMEDFITYNSSSHIKKLYVLFLGLVQM